MCHGCALWEHMLCGAAHADGAAKRNATRYYTSLAALTGTAAGAIVLTLPYMDCALAGILNIGDNNMATNGRTRDRVTAYLHQRGRTADNLALRWAVWEAA